MLNLSLAWSVDNPKLLEESPLTDNGIALLPCRIDSVGTCESPSLNIGSARFSAAETVGEIPGMTDALIFGRDVVSLVFAGELLPTLGFVSFIQGLVVHGAIDEFDSRPPEVRSKSGNKLSLTN